MAHLRIRGEALLGRICSHQTNPVGSSGQFKPQTAFHKCIDGTFSLHVLGQVLPCLFDCSAGKITVCLLLDKVHFACDDSCSLSTLEPS